MDGDRVYALITVTKCGCCCQKDLAVALLSRDPAEVWTRHDEILASAKTEVSAYVTATPLGAKSVNVLDPAYSTPRPSAKTLVGAPAPAPAPALATARGRRILRIVIVGPAGVGKTTWCIRLVTGLCQVNLKHIAFAGAASLNTNQGFSILFDFTEMRSTEHLWGLRNVLSDESTPECAALGCISMCDPSSGGVERACKEAETALGLVPALDAKNVVLVESMSRLSAGVGHYEAGPGRPSYRVAHISTWNDRNVHLPLLLLARSLCGTPDLEFVL